MPARPIGGATAATEDGGVRNGRGVSLEHRFVAAVAALCALTIVATTAAGAGDFSHKGVATTVVDGDTIDVRLANGKQERVRLIGVDTPERGACYAARR